MRSRTDGLVYHTRLNQIINKNKHNRKPSEHIKAKSLPWRQSDGFQQSMVEGICWMS